MNYSIRNILEQKNALSLMLLGQINFNAGLSMMRKLKADATKRVSKTEDDIRLDTSAQDEFASYTPQQEEAPPLDVSVNLVVTSLILAHDIQGDNVEFLKRNIKTPKQIVVNQMDWVANQEAMQRMATAAKFGLTVPMEKFLASVADKNADRITSYVTEAHSSVTPGLKQMESRELRHLIDETFVHKDWATKLEDSCITLYEGAVKRLEEGKFADLPDELIEFAQQALKRRGK